MYVSPSGQDYDIQVKGNRGRALPLVRTHSGHIMLPISGYQGQQNHENQQQGQQSHANHHNDSTIAEWTLICSQSLR